MKIVLELFLVKTSCSTLQALLVNRLQEVNKVKLLKEVCLLDLVNDQLQQAHDQWSSLTANSSELLRDIS